MAESQPEFPNQGGHPEMDALNRLLSLVPMHDERGRVLCLASFAEEALGRLLIGYLREPKQAKELVDGFNAPLGTLAARIKAAFALGLISREQSHVYPRKTDVKKSSLGYTFGYTQRGYDLGKSDPA